MVNGSRLRHWLVMFEIKHCRELLNFLEDNAVEENNPYAPRARYFYKPPIGEKLMRHMHQQIEAKVGRKLYPVSSFVRIHDNGTELREHFDRRGLDWTVSIPVEMDHPWPIETLEDWEWKPNLAEIGESVLVNGTKVPHRRMPYLGQRASILTLSYSEDPRWGNDTLPAEAAAYIKMARLLSAEQIEAVYSEVDAAQLQRTVMKHGEHPLHRTCLFSVLRRPHWQWLYDHVEARMAMVNRMSWRLDIGAQTTDELQYLRYHTGDFYDWHPDTDPRADDHQTKWRTLSASVELRNADKGGGIELEDGGVIPLEIGDAVIFPATARHRAVEVMAGVRDSLVIWLSRQH